MDSAVVIIGGGPGGASAARLLASWGHRVLVLHKPLDRSRGLAESLPPSTLKLFAKIGVLDLVQRAGFYQSTGNTSWWGSGDRRLETFGPGQPAGLQLFRPELDRLLLESAGASGADVRVATVRSVRIDAEGARVDFDRGGEGQSASCRFVLDCSGRAGVIARRFRSPGLRMYALVGAWRAAHGLDLPDPSHTLVETFHGGWAWSVPISASSRHVGVMVDGVAPRGPRRRASDPPHAGDPPTVPEAYHSALAATTAHARLVSGATLQRVWACDASTYSSGVYAAPHFLLVGDAGSFIDPLSSFGVKKALASAWMAAVVVNTCLRHPDRQPAALEFFGEWERGVSAGHARRSREFARDAYLRHPSPFWAVRAESMAEEPAGTPGVKAALQTIQESAELDLALSTAARFEKRPVIRGCEIVLEDAFVEPGASGAGGRGAGSIRYWENVDLVELAAMACRHRRVPDLFEAYCREHGPASLPSVLGGLSLLVAKGILQQRSGA